MSQSSSSITCVIKVAASSHGFTCVTNLTSCLSSLAASPVSIRLPHPLTALPALQTLPQVHQHGHADAGFSQGRETHVASLRGPVVVLGPAKRRSNATVDSADC